MPRTTDIELIGLPKLDKKLTLLEREVYPKAAARAVNSTATTVRKEATRSVAKTMGLKQKDVRSRMKIRKASPNVHSLSAAIDIRGKALNLIRFKARQTKRGVTAAPWGKRRVFPGAFIAKINGTPVVMRRHKGTGIASGQGETTLSRRMAAWGAQDPSRREGRLPIRPMLGPGIAKTAASKELSAARQTTVGKVLPERLKRELAFFVSKMKR